MATEPKTYLCNRCETQFSTSSDLKKHLHVRTIPCDYFCQDCGRKFNSTSSYIRHIKKTCEPQLTYPSVMITNIIKNQNVVNIQNNNVKIVSTDVATFNISKMGIVPIEQEQPILLDKHTRALDQLFTNHIQQMHIDNNANSDENLKSMLLTIIELFHSNKRYPEFMNIVEDDSESELNLVYSATEFVNDLMPKLIRNKRVLQLILDQLEGFLNIGTNTPQLLRFINDIFIPYIYKLYKDDNIPPEMQMYWKNNKRILEMINYRQFPTFPRETITYDKMDQQFSDYYSKDANIMQKIFELNIKNMEKIRRDARRRVIMEGKNLSNPTED